MQYLLLQDCLFWPLGCVQTDATTPNVVAPTMLGVVARVLALVCKRLQQLPTLLRQQCWELLHACWQWCANGWDLQCIVGRIQPRSLCKPSVMSMRGPSNVGRAVQMAPTLLRYASAITEQKKCWELLAEKFGCVQTDATLLTSNSQHCWMLHVASVCTPCCMLLDVVACCCAKFETSQSFQPTTPNISFIP